MGFLGRSSAAADETLARWRSALGDFMPVYFFCAVYVLTVVLGNVIYLTPYGMELAHTAGARDASAALRHVATPGYWCLLTLPLVIVPAAAMVARGAAGRVLRAANLVDEIGIRTYVVLTALIHVYCIYVIVAHDILALNATPADAATSVELRYLILGRVGFVFRLLANSMLPFLVIYAVFAAAHTRQVEWWALYGANVALNSLYLILLNMKWPVLVFWLINLIALFYVTTRHLFIKLVAVSAIYLACYLGVSAFVLGFEARVFRSNLLAEVPSVGELQLTAQSYLLGPAAPGVRFAPGNGAIEIKTIPTEQYQIGSALIRSIPGSGYRIRYAIDVRSGEIAINVLDTDNDRWVTTKPVTESQGELAFVARSERFRVILANRPRRDIDPALATIRSLSVSPMPADLAEKAELPWPGDSGPAPKPPKPSAPAAPATPGETSHGTGSGAARPSPAGAVEPGRAGAVEPNPAGAADNPPGRAGAVEPSPADAVDNPPGRAGAAEPSPAGAADNPPGRAGGVEPGPADAADNPPGRAGAVEPSPANAVDNPPGRPREQPNVARPAGGVAAAIEDGADRGSRVAAALVNRMAIAVPFYYAEFTEKGWICGTVWDRVRRKPSPCSPAIHIYNRMFAGDAFQNRGTATAAVNVSGYALGGWPAAIVATTLAGLLLGAFAAFGRDRGVSAVRASIWIMGAQVAYFLTQLPIEGPIVYDHGAAWWGILLLTLSGAMLAARKLQPPTTKGRRSSTH